MPGTFRRAALAAALLAATLAPVRAGAAVPESGRNVVANGVSLYYEIRGVAGGTPLVVVNGGPGFAHDYEHCSDAWDTLARQRRVMFYDQRGNGRSAALKPGQSCTLADQIKDLEALLDKLGFARVDLLGHSWGGYLAMAYAARHPERIAHLVIVDSAAPKWKDTTFRFDDFYPDVTPKQRAVAFAEELGDSTALAEDLFQYFGMLFVSAEKRDEFRAKHYRYNRAVNAALNADVERFDLTPELEKFRFPTLVVTGRFDVNVSPITAWKIHQSIPGSRFVVFEKSGHLPFFEEPDAFVAELERFLGRPTDSPIDSPTTNGNRAR